MMSPLSLAKFLAANALEFDVLVIDEASQMRPEDALGAMLRARQIVVVGDPLQLPPTSFFERSDSQSDGDGGDEDEIDAESILERCQQVFKDVRRLKWHYRSRCESLIRFSNDNFYNKELITFPAAKPEAFSVDIVRVNGTLQSRRNLAEAERIAESAVEFMHNFAENETVPTLGIVAINGEQRALVFETLRRLSSGDELVERFMAKAESQGEPVFVKNLENVQGDERDHIFISMTYGPPPGAAAPLQRFGPINSANGHRRLNVLFSRARVKVTLFTSFGSEHVIPTEKSNKGVHILKAYLEYAESRGMGAVEGIKGEPDSDFEIEVAGRLRQQGFNVDLQVGVSGFRIDIGIRSPDAPGTFLAGVECDGASYHSSKSARDRDRLREEVLKGLGWQLVRVWSTDWFDNPDRETTKLVARLQQIRAQTPGPLTQDYRVRGAIVQRNEQINLADLVEVEEVPDNTAAAPFTESRSEVDLTELVEAPDDGMKLLKSEEPLTEQQARRALVALRESEIRVVMPEWEPHRSILRDSMIEIFISKRVADPDEWFEKVPEYLRRQTDGVEKRKFFESICGVIDRIRQLREA
jgi:very-short-patch-repair endonuclease